MEKILIITSSYDKTCDYLIKKYRDVDFFRLDFDCFSKYSISFFNNQFCISNKDHSILEEDCCSIYYRKPSPENLSGIIDRKYHSFAYKEAYSLIEGIVEAFSGACLSKPSIMRPAGNKILQARLAKNVGFEYPKYLITNSAAKVNEFNSDKSIVKPLSVGVIQDERSKEFVQTNLLNENIDLEALKYSPSYFQRYQSKDYECRATFIGKKAFIIKIESENDIDWRKLNNKINYSVCEMPNDIYTKCLLFMKECKLEFGCFDFIIKNNIWYFLEMNVNGQWAWLEFEVGVDISGEIMRYLRGK
jgi:glutathione synthase/RimK-type ligase-like ATP-grasp enzyme